jgi:hypothetical protein
VVVLVAAVVEVVGLLAIAVAVVVVVVVLGASSEGRCGGGQCLQRLRRFTTFCQHLSLTCTGKTSTRRTAGVTSARR